MAEFDVDLFVIGGGSGGVRAARIAAGHGARVMIAEEYRMGGTCVIRGCVPKKLFVYAARMSSRRSRTPRASAGPSRSATFDWQTLIANKDKEIARLEAAYAANVEKSPARASSRPAPCSRIRIRCAFATGETVRARHILIATGGAPNHGQRFPASST